MSRKRQTHAIPILDPRGRASVQLTTLSYDYLDGHVVPNHFHNEDQVVFASRGVMTIRTPQGIWVVPPLRAVWIPGGEIHSITMSGIVLMRTLYFAPKVVRAVVRKCLVLNVTPLLRELIIHSCSKAEWTLRVASDRRVIEIIIDQLRSADVAPLQLPQPSDRRALRVVKDLLRNPGDSRTLQEWSHGSGGSKRTIERIFSEETGMTFGRWRQQLRLLHAMKLLASGENVTQAALAAGYSSHSAFIAVFKKSLGMTPGKYFGGAPES